MTTSEAEYEAIWRALTGASHDELHDLADELANGERERPSPQLLDDLSARGGDPVRNWFAAQPGDALSGIPEKFLNWVLEQV